MHTLVVGGTGMLAGVTRWLAEQGHIVSVVSRRAKTFGHVSYRKSLNAIAVDYRDAAPLRHRIAEAIAAYGPIELAVFWIHTDAQEAFGIIADEISNHANVLWRLFHVRGSAAHLYPEPLQVPSNCLYRQVVLGFVAERPDHGGLRMTKYLAGSLMRFGVTGNSRWWGHWSHGRGGRDKIRVYQTMRAG